VDSDNVISVMDVFRKAPHSKITLDQVVMPGKQGVRCIESGGPEPGVGCAGRGILIMFEILENGGFLGSDYDYVIYDVLGDVVCGGFSVPMKQAIADEIYIVTSGELMSLFAANNIAKAIKRFSKRGVKCGGLVPNIRSEESEFEIIERFGRMTNTKVLPPIRRSTVLQQAELAGKTVREFAPESPVAKELWALAEKIESITRDDCTVPTPLDQDEFNHFAREFVR
jgi:nitrogenase iron protein NifH